MTPELIKTLLAKPVNEDLLALMRKVSETYTPEELAGVIARIRAEIALEQMDTDLDTAIAELAARKSTRKPK